LNNYSEIRVIAKELYLPFVNAEMLDKVLVGLYTTFNFS